MGPKCPCPFETSREGVCCSSSRGPSHRSKKEVVGMQVDDGERGRGRGAEIQGGAIYIAGQRQNTEFLVSGECRIHCIE